MRRTVSVIIDATFTGSESGRVDVAGFQCIGNLEHHMESNETKVDAFHDWIKTSEDLQTSQTISVEYIRYLKPSFPCIFREKKRNTNNGLLCL